MTDRIDRSAHELAWPGSQVTTGQAIPGPGTWEVIDHEGCPGDGHLQGFPRGDSAPRCPHCAQEVRWQLTHMAASVAADHRGIGRLP